MISIQPYTQHPISWEHCNAFQKHPSLQKIALAALEIIRNTGTLILNAIKCVLNCYLSKDLSQDIIYLDKKLEEDPVLVLPKEVPMQLEPQEFSELSATGREPSDLELVEETSEQRVLILAKTCGSDIKSSKTLYLDVEEVSIATALTLANEPLPAENEEVSSKPAPAQWNKTALLSLSLIFCASLGIGAYLHTQLS